MPSRERVLALIRMVEQGQFLDAIREFYAEDASMQENGEPPRVGRDRLIEHEWRMLEAHREARTLPGSWFLLEGDRVVIRWVFEFTRRDGTRFRMDELAHQRWRGERIAEERFYYDPGQLRRRS
ncbi:MAG: nuclear transport factor 2 family protein [Betaproteobacteria bacterium]|nr:nuclear transport factor 2 family protein [Betaproteobacteria bacterium]